jgi:hypothetical protein
MHVHEPSVLRRAPKDPAAATTTGVVAPYKTPGRASGYRNTLFLRGFA